MGPAELIMWLGSKLSHDLSHMDYPKCKDDIITSFVVCSPPLDSATSTRESCLWH